MGALQDTTLFLYNITLFPIIFFSVLFLLLCVLNLVMDRPAPRRGRALKSHPFVSVQIPVFNDPVAARCVEHCLAFDYPKDRYELVIADDSTDANGMMRPVLMDFGILADMHQPISASHTPMRTACV